MKKNGYSHIHKWLWLLLVVVVVTTATVNVAVYLEIKRTLATFLVESDAFPQSSFLGAAAVADLKRHILFSLGAGLLTLILCVIAWMRLAAHRIRQPILAIHQAVSRMAQGNLNETIYVDGMDEFGQIGSGINELSANLQELLLYVWKQTGQCLASLERIQAVAEVSSETAGSTELHDALQEMTTAVDSLRIMAKAYVFYDVRLEGDQTLAINHPAQEKGSTPSISN